MWNPDETSQSDDIRQEIAQIRESVELTKSDVRRTRNDVTEYQVAQESHVRRTRALWVIVILLAVSAAGLSWYGPSLLREHEGLLGKMPALQSTLDHVNNQVTGTEQQISAWTKDRAGFSDRISGIEKSLGSNLKTVRNEARLMAQQMKYETGQHLQALQNRVSGVESIQRENSQEVARLRDELSGVRQELASVREENQRHASQISQIEQAHQATRNDVSGLDRRLSSNQTTVNALSNQVERKRIDFELQSGRTQQVVDGIYVTIKNTDVERQQVNGWVQIASDGRIVWLRGEGAQTPIDFSSRADARPYQLVFTRIGPGSTAGYVMVPLTTSASAATN